MQRPLLDINDGDRLVFARLSSNASVEIGDKQCSLTPLVGCGSALCSVSSPAPRALVLLDVCLPPIPTPNPTPLATCMQNLRASRLAIGLQISEPWLREYQVLPSRTHPHMQMNGTGGYILSGIRICSSEASNGEK